MSFILTELLLKTLWEKEKMLVINIFSVSSPVLYKSLGLLNCLNHIYFPSANAFNLDNVEILSFGKEFIYPF